MNERRRRNEPDPKPLFSEAAERAIIGICLHDQTRFWESFGKLKGEHFTQPRLCRIWEAMVRCAEAGRNVNKNYIPLFIKNDAGDDTPLAIFLAVLYNDAPDASEADSYVETVVHLASKRALLDSLEKAKHEIMGMDVGVPAEHMKDVGIRQISSAFNGDTDDDMMDYHQWATRFSHKAAKALNDGEDAFTGLSPGLRSVEQVIGRLLPGKLYVLAGMSSSGKSAIARQIMEAAVLGAAKQRLGYGYVASLEMTGEEYAIRSLAEHVGIPADKMEQGGLNQGEVEVIMAAAAKMSRFPLIVDQRPRMTLETIRARALKVKNTRGLAIMALDHLLLIRGGRQDSLMDRVSEGTIEAKNLAKELGIPVIMLAQIDEKKLLDSTTKWPNTSMLFGGQTITQNADVVVFIHRPEVVLQKTEPPQTQGSGKEGEASPWEKWNSRMERVRGKAWIFNNKRRGGAGNLREEMLFHGPTMTFSDI